MKLLLNEKEEWKLSEEVSDEEKKLLRIKSIMERNLKRHPHALDSWWWKHVLHNVSESLNEIKNESNSEKQE